MMLAGSCTIVCGPDIGEDRISLYLTIHAGRPWFYNGFATREALMKLGGCDDIAATFRAHEFEFMRRAQNTWNSQPESMEYQITVDNVHSFGGYAPANG